MDYGEGAFEDELFEDQLFEEEGFNEAPDGSTGGIPGGTAGGIPVVLIVVGVVIVVVIVIVIIALLVKKSKKGSVLPGKPGVPPVVPPGSGQITLPVPDGTMVRFKNLATGRYLRFAATGAPEVISCPPRPPPANPPGLAQIGYVISNGASNDTRSVWRVGFCASCENSTGFGYSFSQEFAPGLFRSIVAGPFGTLFVVFAPGVGPVTEANAASYDSGFFFDLRAYNIASTIPTSSFGVFTSGGSRLEVRVNGYYDPFTMMVPDCQQVLTVTDTFVTTESLLTSGFYIDVA